MPVYKYFYTFQRIISVLYIRCGTCYPIEQSLRKMIYLLCIFCNVNHVYIHEAINSPFVNAGH